MLGDEEIKESSLMRPGDEIISIHEVCLTDKFYKKELGFGNEALFTSSSKNELEVPRFLRDGFYPESSEQQARFAWTEEDGNIAALVSEPGFGTTGQTTFGKDLDVHLKPDMKKNNTNSVFETSLSKKVHAESSIVSSTSTSNTGKYNQTACKIDKADPRSRYHYVKYVKRHGRTVKLWECGICSRDFQHQYTLMRHLPTHTDERNFHCVACGKSFRQLSTLSQHRAIHSAERPYACEVCNKTFNRVSTLISHRKTHSDEKPYKCHICPKGFHQKGNLRNHLFTHTNERPYRCNICFKGFNQQSNLVCHKNKAHPDDTSSTTSNPDLRTVSRPPRTASAAETQPDSTRQSNDHCEVTSTVGPFLPAVETPSSSTWNPKDNFWSVPKYFPEPIDAWCYTNPMSWNGGGVIVDQIKTYHMGVALATRQTPFALLKPDKGAPVLVKVVDTKLPGGKQMLVPATAADLRDGGKIIVKNEDNCSAGGAGGAGGAVQIRVPVVATVVPRLQPGGRLQLCVEEPHHAYHTALSTHAGEINVGPCSNHRTTRPESPKVQRAHDTSDRFDDPMIRSGRCISSCALPPPAPSPPLDLISMDLFEPIECLPMGPQITAVDNVHQPPGSDDSDIFIGSFEESIPLSDSE
ncbi:zinc finger protein 628 [Papilio machaon]|uniref:zinc finger protein 628 n=1 Tax=Papilio machaon TaxID=76193 RepID=UPI001E665207|nr:zinc finger protein 628 [Papilio machaon]